MKSVKIILASTWTIFLLIPVVLIFSLTEQESNPSKFHLGWVWPSEKEPRLQDHVVGKDGTVYAADIHGTLYAVQAPGQIVWKYDTHDGFTKPPILSPDGSTIYLIHKAQVEAIDENGIQKWFHQLLEGVSITDLVVIAPDGDLYIRTNTSNGNNWGLGGFRVTPDGIFNEFKWPANFHVNFLGIDQQGNIYTWEPGTKIVALNSRGKEILACEEQGDLITPIVIDDAGDFYYVLGNGRVVAHNAKGEKIWEYSTLELKIDWRSPSIPVVIGNSTEELKERIYVGGSEGRLYAIDASDGTLLWRTRRDPNSGNICEITIKESGYLFALTDKGIVLAFDPQGRVLWSEPFYGAGVPGSLYINPQGELVGLRGGRIQTMTQDPALVFQSPTPLPPNIQLEIEEEIVSLMLRKATDNEKYKTLSSSTEASRVRDDPRAILIVYAPTYEDIHSNRVVIRVDNEAPIKAWWYTPGTLVETMDPVKASNEYYKSHSDSFGLDGTIVTFGILSIDPLTQIVEVYDEEVCGPLCGGAFKLTLQRKPDGEWCIIDREFLWVS